ncbi:MAG: hypothetical protein R3F11_15280 [Verrucomicrobiales bacterium]
MWKEIESNETRDEKLTDRYYGTNEDVRKMLDNFAEVELTE